MRVLHFRVSVCRLDVRPTCRDYRRRRRHALQLPNVITMSTTTFTMPTFRLRLKALSRVLLLASSGDIRMLARGQFSSRQRIARHLWRMCFGLFIATGSFFLGQQQVFPVFLRGSILLTLLAVLPFPVMIYWLIRIRFKNAYKIQPAPNPTPVSL